MRSKTLLAAGSLLGLAAAAAWAQLALRPGQYNVTMELTLPGAPTPDAQQDTDCLSPDDAKDLVKAMMRELAAEQSCAASNVATTGNTLKFDATCTVDGNVVSANTELTVKSDTSYSAVMQVNAAGVSTTLKLAGQWVGATCTQSE
jgi:hypothetical protein